MLFSQSSSVLGKTISLLEIKLIWGGKNLWFMIRFKKTQNKWITFSVNNILMNLSDYKSKKKIETGKYIVSVN